MMAIATASTLALSNATRRTLGQDSRRATTISTPTKKYRTQTVSSSCGREASVET